MEIRETPVNTRESSVGLVERPSPGHMGVAKIVRERALEDIMGGKAQEVLRQFRETPERQPLLKDEKFQYWLKQVGVLQTYSESSEEMQALRNFAIKIGMKKKISQTEQFFLMMMSKEGRFSSTDRFTDALEGDRWNPENLEEGGMIEIRRQKAILQEKLVDERGDLRLGATICQVPYIGLGIGIRSFGLDHQQVSVLHYLYLNLGKWIPNTVLTSVLSHGRKRVNPLNSLSVCIRRIKRKAAKLGYLFEIETQQNSGRYTGRRYRVVEKKLPEESRITPERQPSSDKEFQDWLEQQIEEISAVEKLLLESHVTPERQPSSDKEFQDWLEQMHILRRQQSPGIRNFALSPRETSLLYYLYLTREKWVSANRLFSAWSHEEKKRIPDAELASVLPHGKKKTDPLNSLSVYIGRLNRKAAKLGYLFEIKTERGLGYRLVEKQERTVA